MRLSSRVMRRLAVVLLCLSLLACIPATLRAQSGRNRSQPRQPATSSTPDSAPAATTDDNSPVRDGAGAQGEVVESDTVRVDTTLVTLPVSVRDRDGRYIPNLAREDFHVFEEGVEQRLAYFATVDQPFTVALLLDTSRSTDVRLEDIQAAAIAFVRQLKEADRVLVISFDDQVRVMTEPTNDRDELTRAIRRTRTGGSTRLYDAVDFVIKKRLRQIAGRKAIVLFTDGLDTASGHTYESTIRLAEEFDALVYPVSYNGYNSFTYGGTPPIVPGGRGGISIGGLPFPRGGGGRGGDTERNGDAYLHELAQRTGGRFFRGDSMGNISAAFAQVAEELRRQYSLGYYPQPGQAGQRRQIKVRVNQPNLVVLARDSYIYNQRKPDPKDTDGQPWSGNDSR